MAVQTGLRILLLLILLITASDCVAVQSGNLSAGLRAAAEEGNTGSGSRASDAAPPKIVKAEYSAEFNGSGRLDGTVRLTLSRGDTFADDAAGSLPAAATPVAPEHEAALIDVGSTNLQQLQIRHDGQPCPIAMGTAGTMKLIVPSEAKELAGSWWVNGIRRNDAWILVLELPRAVVTVIDLEVGPQWDISGSDAVIRRTDSPTQGSWRIHASDSGRVTIVFKRSGQNRTAAEYNRIAVSGESRVSSTLVRHEWNVQQADSMPPVDWIDFLLSRPVQNLHVADEFGERTDVTVSSAEEFQQTQFACSSAALTPDSRIVRVFRNGPGRSFTIRAESTEETASLVRIPSLIPLQAGSLDGAPPVCIPFPTPGHQVVLPPDLRIVDTTLRGFEEIDVSESADGIQTCIFRNYDPISQLDLTVARVGPLVSEWLLIGPADDSTRRGSIRVRSRLSGVTGRLFIAEWEIPPSWQVTEIRDADSGLPLFFESAPGPDSATARILRVHLRTAVVPGEDARLIMRIQTGTGRSEMIHLPALMTCLSARRERAFCELLTADASAASNQTPLSGEENSAAAELAELMPWASVTPGATVAALSTSAAPPIIPALRPDEDGAVVRADISYSVAADADRVRELQTVLLTSRGTLPEEFRLQAAHGVDLRASAEPAALSGTGRTARFELKAGESDGTWREWIVRRTEPTQGAPGRMILRLLTERPVTDRMISALVRLPAADPVSVSALNTGDLHVTLSPEKTSDIESSGEPDLMAETESLELRPAERVVPEFGRVPLLLRVNRTPGQYGRISCLGTEFACVSHENKSLRIDVLTRLYLADVRSPVSVEFQIGAACNAAVVLNGRLIFGRRRGDKIVVELPAGASCLDLIRTDVSDDEYPRIVPVVHGGAGMTGSTTTLVCLASPEIQVEAVPSVVSAESKTTSDAAPTAVAAGVFADELRTAFDDSESQTAEIRSVLGRLRAAAQSPRSRFLLIPSAAAVEFRPGLTRFADPRLTLLLSAVLGTAVSLLVFRAESAIRLLWVLGVMATAILVLIGALSVDADATAGIAWSTAIVTVLMFVKRAFRRPVLPAVSLLLISLVPLRTTSAQERVNATETTSLPTASDDRSESDRLPASVLSGPLLLDARVSLGPAVDGVVDADIELRAAVRPDQYPTVIALPLTDSALLRCRVNGQESAAFVRPDGRTCVRLTATSVFPNQPLSDRSATGPAASSPASFGRYDVRTVAYRIRVRTETLAEATRVVLPLPMTPETSITVASVAGAEAPALAGFPFHTPVSRRGRFEFPALSAVRSADVRLPLSPEQTEGRSAVRCDATARIESLPEQFRFQCRLDLSSEAVLPSMLTFTVDPTVRITDVSSGNGESEVVWHQSGDRLEIDRAAAPLSSVRLNITGASDVSTTGLSRTIQLRGMICPNAAELNEVLLFVAAGSPFRTESVTCDTEKLTVTPNSSQTVPPFVRTTDLQYRLPAEFSRITHQLRIPELLPAVTSEQTLTVGTLKSGWSWTASAELQGRNLLRAAVEVPETVRLADVRVSSGGINRMQSFERAGSLVLITLREAVSETLRIEMSGTMRGLSSGPLRVPVVRLRNSRSSGDSVLIAAETDDAAVVTRKMSGNGEEEISTELTNSPIRVELPQEQGSEVADMYPVVSSLSAEPPAIHGVLLFHAGSEAAADLIIGLSPCPEKPFALRIPEAFSFRDVSAQIGDTAVVVSESDGSITIDPQLRTSDDVPRPASVGETGRSDTDAPAEETRLIQIVFEQTIAEQLSDGQLRVTVPVPDSVKSLTADAYVLHPDGAMKDGLDGAFLPQWVRTTGLPQTIANRLAFGRDLRISPDEEANRFRVELPSAKSETDGTVNQNATSLPRSVCLHQVTVPDEGALAGYSRLVLENPAAVNRFEIKLPDRISVRDVTVNGRHDGVSVGNRTLRISAAENLIFVEIRWLVPRMSRSSPARRVGSLLLPEPAETQALHFVKLSVTEDSGIRPAASVSTESGVRQQLLDRLTTAAPQSPLASLRSAADLRPDEEWSEFLQRLQEVSPPLNRAVSGFLPADSAAAESDLRTHYVIALLRDRRELLPAVMIAEADSDRVVLLVPVAALLFGLILDFRRRRNAVKDMRRIGPEETQENAPELHDSSVRTEPQSADGTSDSRASSVG